MGGLNGRQRALAWGSFKRRLGDSESQVNHRHVEKLATASASLKFNPAPKGNEDHFAIFNALWIPAISFDIRPASGSPQ